MPEGGERLRRGKPGKLLMSVGENGEKGGTKRESGGTYRFIHSSAWTNYIDASEFFDSGLEHAFELRPIPDIRLLEDGAARGGGGRGVCVDDLFGFRSESQVSQEDVALFAEEEAGEGEVDAWQVVRLPMACISFNSGLERRQRT